MKRYSIVLFSLLCAIATSSIPADTVIMNPSGSNLKHYSIINTSINPSSIGKCLLVLCSLKTEVFLPEMKPKTGKIGLQNGICGLRYVCRNLNKKLCNLVPEKGKDFVERKIKVPTFAFFYNGNVLDFSKEMGGWGVSPHESKR